MAVAPPPCCLSCGLPIGDVSEIFSKILAERLIEKYGNVYTSKILTRDYPPMGDILDKLEVTQLCCRAHIMTAMDWINYVKI